MVFALPRRAAIAALAGLLGASVGARAQSPIVPSPSPAAASASTAATESSATLFESVQVEVVNLEVVVTDRSGRPVPGLRAEDFSLTLDGSPVEIQHFSADSPAALAAVTSSGTGANPEDGAVAPSAIPKAARPSLALAVFLEEEGLEPRLRRRALEAIGDALETALRPGDVVLLARSNRGALDLLLAPTADRTVARQAFVAAGQSMKAIAGGERRGELLRLLSDLRTGGDPNSDERYAVERAEVDARDTLQRIEQLVDARRREGAASIAAAAQLVELVGALPGRRAILLVSGGFGANAGQSVFEAWNQRYGAIARHAGAAAVQPASLPSDLAERLRQLADLANAQEVTLYGLGASEVVKGDSIELGGESPLLRGDEGLESVGAVQSLGQLADATGGAVGSQPERPGVLLAQLMQDCESRYSLGFSPPSGMTGTAHRVRVALRPPELRARYRSSLRRPEPGAALRQLTLAALVAEDVPAISGSAAPSASSPASISAVNRLGLAIAFEAVDAAPAARTADAHAPIAVPLLVTMPMASLALLPREHVHEGRATLFVASRDGDGRFSPVTRISLPVRVPNEKLLQALGQELGYRARLSLRPGPQRIAVTLHDEVGGSTATVVARWPPALGTQPAPGVASAPPGQP